MTQEEMAAKAFDALMKNLSYRAWYESEERTDDIREMARNFPFETYKIKEGAPYAVSCPGTIVHLHCYSESGKIGVIVLAEDKLPGALEHEEKLFEENKSKRPAGLTIDSYHKQNVLVYVEAEFLEPYFPPAKVDAELN